MNVVPVLAVAPVFRPLGKRAAVALVFLGACAAAMSVFTWRSFVHLVEGVPVDAGGVSGFDVLYWTLFILAAWAVIRWADLAQDNLPALEAPLLSSRLEWFEWVLPGLNLVSPGFGMVEVSRSSNPVYDLGTGRGRRLGSLLPWWLLWASAQFVGWTVPLLLFFFPGGSETAGLWLAGAGGVLALLAAGGGPLAAVYGGGGQRHVGPGSGGGRAPVHGLAGLAGLVVGALLVAALADVLGLLGAAVRGRGRIRALPVDAQLA